MRKRLLFHAFNFFMLCLSTALAVAVYFKTSYAGLAYSLKMSYEFILGNPYNFAIIVLVTYFLGYVTGFIKYTIEDKYFTMVKYLKEIFKLLLILVTANFVEFFVFFDTQIGRLIYVYLFVIFSFYYLLYFRLRSERGPRRLLWLAPVPAADILEKYIDKNGNFRIIKTEKEEKEAGLDAYVVYQDGHIDEKTSEALIRNKLAGYTVVELVELVEKVSGKIPLDYVNIHWFLEKFDVVDRNYFRTNRMFSIFMSLILLILLFPVGFLTALVHRLFSKGPIFFIQQRTGLHGDTFNLVKFRTMVDNAEKEGARFAEKNDRRITPVGKFMRRLRIDEIPQFINVLKGDMSMVGPRPERKVFIETLSKELPYYKLRLLVPPGLTGWAQVNGVYAGNDVEDHKEKLEYDLYYIKNRNIFMDLLILLRTVKTILQGRGE
jgi:lipopolysaccharide/colanic/teichoic acid biosynthesis glycosyltransferase